MPGNLIASIFDHPNLPGMLVVAGKTTVVYIFLVMGLRLLGKRELGQMNIYDLVLIAVLANAVQNAMLGRDSTLIGGLAAALTLLLLNWISTLLVERSPAMERLVMGEPVLIVRDGRLMERNMRREGVTCEEVLAAIREHGLEALDQVALCVLEIDGSLSVVPKESGVFRTRRHFRQLRI